MTQTCFCVCGPTGVRRYFQHLQCALVLVVPAFIWVLQHVPGQAVGRRQIHDSMRGHARQDLVHCKLHGWPFDGNVQSCRRGLNSARSLGNSSTALCMFLPLALEAGVLEPRESVWWVAAPHETSRRPSNGVPDMVSFSGLSSETWRLHPWQNLDIGCLAQHSVQVVKCGKDIVRVARRGEPRLVVVESQGDDLHRRTAGCCKSVDDSNTCSPLWCRASLLPKPTAAALHQTFSAGSLRSCLKQERGRRPPSRRTWQQVCRADLTSLCLMNPTTGPAWSTRLEGWTG